MSYRIINKISGKNVPRWGNKKKYIAIHYLGVDGQNYELAPGGTGSHYTIYWDGTIYQRCDLNAIVYAVGTAGYYTQKHPEANNSNTISIELCCHCDGNVKDPNDLQWWFTLETQEAAVWLVKKLMNDLDIPESHVLRHYDIVNKVCPAPYVHNNKYRTSWTWDEFKSKITGKEIQWYRVRKSWENEKSQIGAYEDLENAKANCKPGYSVYDNQGKELFTVAYNGKHTNSYFDDMDEETRAEKALKIIKKTDKSGICWSVTTAQWILESGYGTTDLARNAENYFGMKVNLSNNSWKTVWDGKSNYIKQTEEQDLKGKSYMVTAAFRKYPYLEDSILDHAAYITGAMNGSKPRYPDITALTTAEEQIKLIKAGGYATDVKYVEKVLNIIRRFNLDRYDSKVKHTKKTVEVVDIYRVRTAWLDSTSQIGAFNDLQNAIACCNQNPGYKIFDQFGNVLYSIDKALVPYQVKIKPGKIINIREQPSLKANIAGLITPGVYTIVSERKADNYTWGELKSGAGWIALEFADKIS